MLEADSAEKTFCESPSYTACPILHCLSSFLGMWPLEQKGHEICAFRSLLGQGPPCSPRACNSTRHPVGTQKIFVEWRALTSHKLQDSQRHGSVSFAFVSAFGLARSVLEWGGLRIRVHISQRFSSSPCPALCFICKDLTESSGISKGTAPGSSPAKREN